MARKWMALWLVLSLFVYTGSTGVGAVDTTFAWQVLDLNACRAAKKPILLYIYDGAMKGVNNTTKSIEKNVFLDAKVKEAVSGFTYAMLRRDGKGWPAEFFARADGGAALFVMTCDGSGLGAWGKDAPPTAVQVVTAAKQATAANTAAAERMAKKPPPKFEDKPKEVAGANPAAAPAEKPPEKITVPGLGADAPKQDAPKKPDEIKKKAGKVEDE